MKFNIQPDSHANITFNGDVRVSVKGEFPYLVKWFCDEVFIGEMFLNGGCWGAYGLQVGNWKVEFWIGEDLINTCDNNLTNQNILLVPKIILAHPGKHLELSKLIERVNYIKSVYGCQVVCYIPNSEHYSFPDSIITYKMNDNYNFKMMIEEWIA